MKHVLIRQSLVVPLVAMLVPMLAALGVPHYSSVSQHISELQLLNHPVASVMRVSPVITGLSVFMFGIGAYLTDPARFAFTALTAAAVAANFVSSGIFPSGSPLHGLYGIGFFIPLVPACFAAEAGLGRSVSRTSLAAAVLAMAYLWLNLSGLDPYRGLTQRIAIFFILGWYSYASYLLLHMPGSAKGGAASAGTSRSNTASRVGLDPVSAVSETRA
ncbi:MAG: DUF998 domain-containing protein [Thermomonas sp.]